MPNVIGESAAQALAEICEVQGQTRGLFDGSEDWNGCFVDEDGNILYPSFSEAQNVYEVVSVSPAAGTLMGKDDKYSICIKKNAAAVKAEREEAASKLIKNWEERFGAGKGTYEVYDFNCVLVSITHEDNGGVWRMEQQEQDTLDLFAEKQKCNVLLFMYDSDGYIIGAYNAFYSGSSDEDTASFVSLGVKKIADAKKVTDSEIEQFMAGMSRAFSNEGIESVKWGKDGDYLTFEVRLKSGLYNAVKGDKAKEGELKEMLDIMANQIAYLMKSNFELVFVQDDFTVAAKAEYKGDFFTNNDEFNEWASKILA